MEYETKNQRVKTEKLSALLRMRESINNESRKEYHQALTDYLERIKQIADKYESRRNQLELNLDG